ncbi:MAG: hypothetical protein HC875_18445 [Anaerolineales bacterium]|nr:hypothetical protein [Anaerolineales bacterium]
MTLKLTFIGDDLPLFQAALAEMTHGQALTETVNL